MPVRRRLVIFTLACLVSAPASSAGQKLAAEDAKEIAAYELTAAALQKVMNVNRAMVQQLAQDPKIKEAMQVEAEIDALEDKETLTEADEKRMEELQARRTALEDATGNPLGGDARTLAEMESRIRAYPPLVQALQKEGMAPREYARFWLAFIQAAFVHGFQKSGMLKELPPEVNPANVRFMEQHAAEIAKMQAEFEALSRKP